MAKLTHAQFREVFPNATITAWVRYRYCNGRLPIPEGWIVKKIKDISWNMPVVSKFNFNPSDFEINPSPTIVQNVKCSYLPTTSMNDRTLDGCVAGQSGIIYLWDKSITSVSDLISQKGEEYIYYKKKEN